MKRIVVAFVLTLCLIPFLTACRSSARSKKTETPMPSETQIYDHISKPTAEPTKIADNIQIELQDAFKESIGSSGVLFYKSVRNDVTGRWRVAVVFSSEKMVDHALDYYKAYFSSDDELHFVCNRGLKTTTSIRVVFGKLQVDVHKYVDKEELDAKILNSGTFLTSYWVDMETGLIEELK